MTGVVNKEDLKMNKPEKELSIESLVQCNGNWRVVYTYCNWGDNILYLLPNYQTDDEEALINISVVEASDDICELDMLINQFMEQHPSMPFIIRGKNMSECVSKMESRLEAYCGDWNRFIDDSAIFDRWRKVVHYVYSEEERLAYHAYHIGWEAVYTMMKEAKKNEN